MGKSDVDIKQLSSVIVSDAVLSAEVLRISNSAAFGIRSEVRSILHAIAMLGTERVKGLAMTIALQNYMGNVLQIPALKRCWRHNTATAIVANELASWTRTDGAEAYTVGILHDIGRLGLIAMSPAQYIGVLESALAKKIPLREAEVLAYGLDHTECGHWLAKMWGLPAPIQSIIQTHHDEGKQNRETLDAVVHYACKIADFFGFSVLERDWEGPDPVATFIDTLPDPLRKRLSIDTAELQVLIASQINALES